ncbi:mRNA 3'-end processing factor [Natronococcus sp. A-GB1]|uniref:mRNA 3'-end processing factor n=1 Tax=Natronococcus sp. A-GB1 TaxID=3037648 RepID=UPI00241E7640|nr:mRNA 3'-end processing factor [Natronococcus sp. A-GB1]MDG5760543.1 mRNA 3'-end processing factor [Natronococcus sp. A-GB1]
MRRVRLGDGIRFDLTNGETVVCDGERSSDGIRVLSHAHGDHLYREDPGAVICSDVTAALARVRREDTPLERTTHPAVDLHDAGHVPGSRATHIADPDGTTYCYTGDCSTRDRFYLEGFDPDAVDADVLVIEATYGEPEYVLPPQETVEAEIVDWLEDTADRPVLLFGYTLGRAQELQLLVNRSSRDRLFVTQATERINAVVEDHYDIDFGARRYRDETELGAGDALILPSQTSKLSFVDALVRDADAIKAGFSGWAIDDSFQYRGDYDVTFPLSDHCDFTELVDVVRGVDPDVVYTQHGSAAELATHLETVEGYEAYPLVRNQRSLGDF